MEREHQQRQGWHLVLTLSLHRHAGMTGTVPLLTSAFSLEEEGVTASFTLLLAPVDAVQECACWSRSLGELGTLCPQHVEIVRLSKSLCWGLLACGQLTPLVGDVPVLRREQGYGALQERSAALVQMSLSQPVKGPLWKQRAGSRSGAG